MKKSKNLFSLIIFYYNIYYTFLEKFHIFFSVFWVFDPIFPFLGWDWSKPRLPIWPLQRLCEIGNSYRNKNFNILSFSNIYFLLIYLSYITRIIRFFYFSATRDFYLTVPLLSRYRGKLFAPIGFYKLFLTCGTKFDKKSKNLFRQLFFIAIFIIYFSKKFISFFSVFWVFYPIFSLLSWNSREPRLPIWPV